MITSRASLVLVALLAVACGSPAVESGSELAAQGSTLVGDFTPSATLSSGSFDGRNDHVVTGQVQLMDSDQGMLVLLGEDFSLDGAPDPKLGFGTDGVYDPSTTFTALQMHNGAQAYRIPASVNLAQHNELVLWCDQFSVPLGIARLN